jgi:hypothetical protein
MQTIDLSKVRLQLNRPLSNFVHALEGLILLIRHIFVVCGSRRLSRIRTS